MNDLLLILKAMSDKNRLRILRALLTHEELCACQITEFLEVAGATASRHLSLMVNAGILKKIIVTLFMCIFCHQNFPHHCNVTFFYNAFEC